LPSYLRRHVCDIVAMFATSAEVSSILTHVKIKLAGTHLATTFVGLLPVPVHHPSHQGSNEAGSLRIGGCSRGSGHRPQAALSSKALQSGQHEIGVQATRPYLSTKPGQTQSGHGQLRCGPNTGREQAQQILDRATARPYGRAHSTVKCNEPILGVEENLARGLGRELSLSSTLCTSASDKIERSEMLTVWRSYIAMLRRPAEFRRPGSIIASRPKPSMTAHTMARSHTETVLPGWAYRTRTAVREKQILLLEESLLPDL
jgi:hypothetical protein